MSTRVVQDVNRTVRKSSYAIRLRPIYRQAFCNMLEATEPNILWNSKGYQAPQDEIELAGGRHGPNQAMTRKLVHGFMHVYYPRSHVHQVHIQWCRPMQRSLEKGALRHSTAQCCYHRSLSRSSSRGRGCTCTCQSGQVPHQSGKHMPGRLRAPCRASQACPRLMPASLMFQRGRAPQRARQGVETLYKDNGT